MNDTLSTRGYQQRVIDERADLCRKLEKLDAFMAGPVYEGLPLNEKNRLTVQRGFMIGYAEVLRQRIEDFGPR